MINELNKLIYCKVLNIHSYQYTSPSGLACTGRCTLPTVVVGTYMNTYMYIYTLVVPVWLHGWRCFKVTIYYLCFLLIWFKYNLITRWLFVSIDMILWMEGGWGAYERFVMVDMESIKVELDPNMQIDVYCGFKFLSKCLMLS